MAEPDRPYCYACMKVAVPYVHFAPCPECGTEDAIEETAWKPSCECGCGLMWPGISDKIHAYEAKLMPLYVLTEKSKCDSE